MELLVTIGLNATLAAALDARLDARLVSYPAIPSLCSLDGVTRVESTRVAGRMLEPRGVIFHGYFDTPEAAIVRRALAMSETPTFPDVRRTLLLDDKVLGLIAALGEGVPRLPRGFVPAGELPRVEGERVLKWGNRHCGEDKARATTGARVPEPAIVEPFVVGRSERILLIGDAAWQLHYESDDWRKNVRSTITVMPSPDPALLALARTIAARLGLDVAGIDFVVAEGEPFLLEVNAYPGLDDAPGASEAFVELAAAWWERVTPE